MKLNYYVALVITAFIIVILSGCKTSAQIFNETQEVKNDSLPPSVIEISPQKLFVPIPKGKYFTKKVEVFNRGGQPLEIQSIKSSCFCANATAMQKKVYSFEIGEIYLSINLDGLKGNKIVEFTINSNAENSPLVYEVEFTTGGQEKSGTEVKKTE